MESTLGHIWLHVVSYKHISPLNDNLSAGASSTLFMALNMRCVCGGSSSKRETWLSLWSTWATEAVDQNQTWKVVHVPLVFLGSSIMGQLQHCFLVWLICNISTLQVILNIINSVWICFNKRINEMTMITMWISVKLQTLGCFGSQ